MRGPIANPSTKREMPRVATSLEIPKSVRIVLIPPLKAEEAKDTANVAFEMLEFEAVMERSDLQQRPTK